MRESTMRWRFGFGGLARSRETDARLALAGGLRVYCMTPPEDRSGYASGQLYVLTRPPWGPWQPLPALSAQD
eukprot:7008470-Prymnesium_polylepis.1